ncbi:DUF3108 domain-containing protein [Gemmatimonas sp.]|uniref:DUF3108 domain-containing protein n=1 Tax=Gemmatimonas sp. TaxID=1962908 RepID=UPI00286DA2D7|nr:DUF3108 domain-containing protein [Gemmatimonas sp.]
MLLASFERRRSSPALIAVALLVVLAAQSPRELMAQAARSGTPVSAPGTSPTIAPALAAALSAPSRPAFAMGEVLDYRVNVSRAGNVGQGQMRVEGPVMERGTLTWRLVFVMQAQRGPIKAIDRTTSWIDPTTFATTRFEKTERHPLSRDQETVEIDAANGTWARNNGAPQALATPLPLDELSFMYFLRGLPLEHDGTFTFSRHFDEARNPTVVYVRGEELVETPAGVFRTRVLDMHVRDPKRFQGAGVIRINLDMAGCHMPVRIMSRMPIIGTTTLTLTNVTSTATIAEQSPASCTQ